MSPQFKSWAVANIEFLISGGAVVLLSIITCFFPFPKDGVSFGYWFVIYLIIAAFLSPSKTVSVGITKFVIALLISIVYGVLLWGSGHVILSLFTFLILFTSFIPSKMVAAYARENIDDVLSSRILWRNSDVSLFEITWKYAADRFMGTSSTIIFWWIVFLLMVDYCIYPEMLSKIA